MAGPNPITQALERAMAHSSEPMALSDPRAPDDPMVAVNDAFLALTGYGREDVLGRNCRFLQGPGTDPRTVRNIGRHLRAGHGCVEWIVNHRRDGSAFWNLLFLSPVYDRDGTLLHFFGNQQNITTGCPAWLGEFFVGEAHMPEAVEAEFQRLIVDLVASGDDGGGLDGIVTSARRLAEVSTRLVPGPAGVPA